MTAPINTFKVIFFDLDRTLWLPSSMGKTLFDPMRPLLGRLGFDQVTQDRMITKDWWNGTPWEVVDGITEDPLQRQMLLDAYNILPIPTCGCLLPDADAFLRLYETLPAENRPILVLITRGLPTFQKAKIMHLQLRPPIRYVQVVGQHSSSYFDDKLSAIRYLASQLQAAPENCCVVGDNAHDEIAAGCELGMTTVQTLRKGVTPADEGKVDHQITDLADLWPILGMEAPVT